MSNFAWPDGKVAAVSLSYDDAMECHFQLVGPKLEAMGFRGTFYAPIRENLWNNVDKWRAMAAAGHELGNHTIFHPCRREPKENFNWLDDAHNLCHYTPKRFASEVAVASGVLHMIDGLTERTYGNTCHNTTLGTGENEQPLDEVINAHFLAGRGARTDDVIDPATANMANLGTVAADGKPPEVLMGLIDKAIAVGGWVLFTMHGVGPGTQRLQKDEGEHQQILDYLAARRQVWTAPVIEIARYVRKQRGLA